MLQSGSGLITDIHGFSIHDGPGIRTTVFLKGCPLACLWCHSPHTMNPRPEILFYEQHCRSCGTCAAACPSGAQECAEQGRIFHRKACTGCGSCTNLCPHGAVRLAGRVMSVQDVMDAVLKDVPFYSNSGGGVTFSGGEPLFQAPFLARLLAACREQGIHTAVDTSGSVPWDSFGLIHPHTDLFLYDLKLMDSERHRACTGSGNTLILQNLKKLDQLQKRIHIRIPVIPGINDDMDNIGKSADFIAGLSNVELVELLAFNPLGAAAYAALGREYPLARLRALDRAGMEALGRVFEKNSLVTIIR